MGIKITWNGMERKMADVFGNDPQLALVIMRNKKKTKKGKLNARILFVAYLFYTFINSIKQDEAML